MGQPVMGIAANEIMDAGKTLYHLPISYTPSGYVKAINNAGGLPLILPIGSPDIAKDYVNKIDKLILAGGQNVAPKWYGETLQFEESTLAIERDVFEMALIEEAIHQKKPIFAICRGMQLANVAFGGSLHQDISQITDGKIQHMQAPIAKEIPTHGIRTTDTSILRKIYGTETQVNSFHGQAVKKLAPSLKATAYSEDGIIEGVESKLKSVPFLGVQWHPDFAYDHLEQEMNIFHYAVKKL